MQESFEGKEQKVKSDLFMVWPLKTLDELKFKSYKVMAVEVKETNEKWTEYDPSKIILKINIWRPNLFDLEEKALNPER